MSAKEMNPRAQLIINTNWAGNKIFMVVINDKGYIVEGHIVSPELSGSDTPIILRAPSPCSMGPEDFAAIEIAAQAALSGGVAEVIWGDVWILDWERYEIPSVTHFSKVSPASSASKFITNTQAIGAVMALCPEADVREGQDAVGEKKEEMRVSARLIIDKSTRDKIFMVVIGNKGYIVSPAFNGPDIFFLKAPCPCCVERESHTAIEIAAQAALAGGVEEVIWGDRWDVNWESYGVHSITHFSEDSPASSASKFITNTQAIEVVTALCHEADVQKEQRAVYEEKEMKKRKLSRRVEILISESRYADAQILCEFNGLNLGDFIEIKKM